MKSIIILIALTVFISVSFAEFYEDGFLTEGEYESDIQIRDFNLFVQGGGALVIFAKGECYLEVQSTSIPTDINWYTGGIRDIAVDDNTELLHLGGYTQEITVYDDSTAILKGGYISAITSFQYADTKHVDLYCLSGWSWKWNLENEIIGITGQWADQSPFDIFLIDRISYGYDPAWMNVNVIEVPEPVSLLMLSFGGLLGRVGRAHRKFSG